MKIYSCTKRDLSIVERLLERHIITLNNAPDIDKCIFEVDDDDLWILNKWRYFPYYQLTTKVIKYQGHDCELLSHVCVGNADEMVDIPLSRLEKEIKHNPLNKCDIHLLIPCSCPQEGIPIPDVEISGVKFFIDQLMKTNEAEFSNDFVKNLERHCLGAAYLYYRGEDNDKIYQPCFILYSVHEFTNLAVVDIVIPDAQVDGLRILEEFRYKSIGIIHNGQDYTLDSWLKNSNLQQFGEHRNLLFSYQDLPQTTIVNVLATEYNPMGEIMGDTFIGNANENFAQYDTAKVYVSEVSLLEISTKNPAMLEDRLSYQAIEVFFVELIQLQDAAIGRVSSKVKERIASERASGEASITSLEKLVSEMSRSILFFEPTNFIFPTVRRSAERVAKRFGLDKAMTLYRNNKEMLEQMINLAKIQRENKENTIINFILIMLTIVQVLPILANAIHYIVFKEIDIPELISEITAFSICLIVCIQFYRIRRRYMMHL